VEYVLKPIAQTVIKMDLTVKADFIWNSRWHSTKEIFWLMVDDQNEIFHQESFAISATQIQQNQSVNISFFIPYRSKATYYRLSVTSDSWVIEDI
jgi:hypothetical protein